MLESPTINDSFAFWLNHLRLLTIFTARDALYQPLLVEGRAKASIKTRTPPALLLGDHSVSAPPDPISNSAVKPDRADGTIA